MQAGHLWPQMRKTGDYRLSGNLLFCLLVAEPPNPFSQNFILRLRTVPALFPSAPGGDFLQPARLAYQHNRKLPRKGNRHFFKNPSGSQSRSQRETLFKGFGMLPNKQNLRSPASPEIVGFERLYIQTPCLPSSAWLLFSPALDKNFPNSIDRNACLCYHDGELNTAHIFHADT